MSESARGFDQARRHSRRRVRLAAWLRTPDGRQLSAVTEDVSAGGAFLRVDGLPEGAAALFASIALTPSRSVHVRADVRWRRGEPAGVGVQFDGALPELETLDL